MTIRQTLVTSFLRAFSPGFQNPGFLLPLFTARKSAQICSKLAANLYQFCHFHFPNRVRTRKKVERNS
jgi:hypothetical protein